MSLQALIKARRDELTQLGDPGDDEQKKARKVVLEGEVKALEEAEQDKEVFTQDDLNRIDREAKEQTNTVKGRIEKMFGTDIESVEGVLENLENVLPKAESEGDQAGAAQGSTDDGDVLNRALSTIKTQGDTIQNLQTSSSNFQRQYYGGEVERRLNAELQSLGLVKEYQSPASSYLQNVVGVSDLVDKRMKGEEVTPEEIKEKAGAVKTASEVWFSPPVNPDAPSIPVTPGGDQPKEYTDEERRNVSVASGGKVF